MMLSHRFLNLPGFTLAELLISLAILGVIATFTIPKVLQAEQNQKYKAMAKEAAGSISEAYKAYQLDIVPASNMHPSDLTPYLNYVKVLPTGSQIDHAYSGTVKTCDSSEVCVQLHNGAVLLLGGSYFNGTAVTNAIHFFFDPDGKVTDGTTNGPGKSVEFLLYYDGRITTRDDYILGTCSSLACPLGATTDTPPWFSWN